MGSTLEVAHQLPVTIKVPIKRYIHFGNRYRINASNKKIQITKFKFYEFLPKFVRQPAFKTGGICLNPSTLPSS